MKLKLHLLFLSILMCSVSFAQQKEINENDITDLKMDSVDITFRVNMSLETVDPAGVFIAGGGNFGNPGDYALTDLGSGIWEMTTRRPKLFSSFYTITNGACPNYSCKENLAGLPCGDPANFNDRFIDPVLNDTTLQHCFGQCTSNGSCVATTPVNVVFRVDMSETPGASDTIYVTGGSLDGWCGSCLLMDDSDGDGIFVDTLALTPGSYEFKFLNGGWPGEEVLDPSADSLCTLTTGQFTNRLVTVGMTDTTLTAFCFNTCDPCMQTSISVISEADDQINIAPNPTDDYLNVLFEGDRFIHGNMAIYSITGQIIQSAKLTGADIVTIDVKDFPKGMYLLSVRNETEIVTHKVLIK